MYRLDIMIHFMIFPYPKYIISLMLYNITSVLIACYYAGTILPQYATVYNAMYMHHDYVLRNLIFTFLTVLSHLTFLRNISTYVLHGVKIYITRFIYI